MSLVVAVPKIGELERSPAEVVNGYFAAMQDTDPSAYMEAGIALRDHLYGHNVARDIDADTRYTIELVNGSIPLPFDRDRHIAQARLSAVSHVLGLALREPTFHEVDPTETALAARTAAAIILDKNETAWSVRRFIRNSVWDNAWVPAVRQKEPVLLARSAEAYATAAGRFDTWRMGRFAIAAKSRQ